MGNYFRFLGHFAIVTAIIIAFGRMLAWNIGDGSKRRRVHGVFVLWWSISGFVLGGVLAPFISAADTPSGYFGMAGFGLLIGWMIGTAHGFLILTIRPVDKR